MAYRPKVVNGKRAITIVVGGLVLLTLGATWGTWNFGAQKAYTKSMEQKQQEKIDKR